MKKEIAEKTLAYLPSDFDGVVLDINSKVDSFCPNAKIVFAKNTDDISAQADGSIEIAVCLKLHKLSDISKALDGIHRVLKNDGTFIACLKPQDGFRTELKAKFNVNSYRTEGQYAYFEAQKRI
ncbi:MAG: hypothetical protein IJ077_00550 [Eubacterium sp.]|nr:hypothetical protein [Eubacterium sp.]